MGKLIKGENDLLTWCNNNGEFGQQLISEWTGECEDGYKYNINSVKYNDRDAKFKFKCKYEHEWFTLVATRTYNKTSCFYCRQIKNSRAKLKIGQNDFKSWCSHNGGFGKHLMSEWVGKLENGDDLQPDAIQFSSHTIVEWKCSRGHSFFSSVNQRTNSGSGCPNCRQMNIGDIIRSSKLNNGDNDLLTWCKNNGDYGKQILSEWTGQSEDNKHLELNEISFGSQKKMKWKCNNGHIWVENIVRRTGQRTGCPYCSSRRVSDKNSLGIWCINNGEFGKQLLSEWTGELQSGDIIQINSIAKASSQKVKWKCSKGHEWYATIASRTYSKSCCPICNVCGTSYPEQFLYRALLQIYPKTISRGKIQGYEYDVIIPEERACIEYGSMFWHSDKLERDKEKEKICKENDIKFILIYDSADCEDTYEDNLIIFHAHYENRNTLNNQLERILKHILKILGKGIDGINIEKAQTEAFNFMHNIDNTEDTQQTNEKETN